MTLTGMLVRIGLVALVLTGISFFGLKKKDHPIMSFLQHFVGALFIFSGWVKAIDPLGTAYKMEQYFGEFKSLFSGTWFEFISPFFPFLAQYAVAFSVFMVVFEIVLGIMLIFGIRPKFTSWAFLLLVVFFTILTGFTFLTGFVPLDGALFNISSWTAYNPNNMKVTDCGCFGDFIKLEPKVSFFKDLFLLLPGIYFVLRSRDMHKLFSSGIRSVLLTASIILLLVYSFSNYVWDLPHIDFRPFKIGADVAGQKIAEEDAMANVQIVAWKLKSNEDPSKIVELPNDIFLKEFASKYKGKYEVVEQIKTEPSIKKTKISDFELADLEGNDFTEEFLQDNNYSIMLVCHKLKGSAVLEKSTVTDSIFRMDTIQLEDSDSIVLVKNLEKVETREVSRYDYKWDPAFADKFNNKVNPFIDKVNEAGIKTYLVAGGADAATLEDFDFDCGPNVQYLTADDILLKTIVRSNPGIVLWKKGQIIYKWHINKLPSFEEIRQKFMQ